MEGFGGYKWETKSIFELVSYLRKYRGLYTCGRLVFIENNIVRMGKRQYNGLGSYYMGKAHHMVQGDMRKFGSMIQLIME